MSDSDNPTPPTTNDPIPPLGPVGPSSAPLWVLIVGVGFLLLSVIFFMVLVIAGIFDYSVPDGSRFLVCIVLALCVGASSGFLGGSASASGKIGEKGQDSPVGFGLAGGVAFFIIVLLICHYAYGPSPPRVEAPVINSLATSDGGRGWKNLNINFQEKSLPPNHKLSAEVASDAGFTQIVKSLPIDNPLVGDALLTFPYTETGKTKLWVRMVVRSQDGHIVAKSNATILDVTPP
jgi:hypothetical protein